MSECGSVRCKTYFSRKYFTNNVTKRLYKVLSSSTSMNCVSENIVYLITCKRCGVQYVGETSQKLRNRLKNHRSSLKRLTSLYLYHHFSSDGLTVDNIAIMPIEEITPVNGVNVTSLRLKREDYWCRLEV